MAAPLSAEEYVDLLSLEAASGADSLIEYVSRISPHYVAPWHLAPVARMIARAEYGPVRGLVSVPPRQGKTELFVHAIPWWLDRHPTAQIAYVSYAADLAHKKSAMARDYAISAGIKLNPRRMKAEDWATTAGGQVIATGVGGPLLGEGANLLIIDDCTKNREEAESPRIRDKVDEWFTSTAMSRVEPVGSVIVVHQRWHSDDLIGRCLKRGGWEHINLPVISNGKPLWPWRWTPEALELKKRDVGEYDWSSQWLGSPQPKGGKLFRLPTTYGRWPDLDGARILIVCDPAATSENRGDHSAIVVGAGKLLKNGLPQVDILEVHRLKVAIPVLVGYLLQVQKKWGVPIGVESVAGFKGVPQSLRAHDKRLKIFDITPTTDKFVRALPAAAAWNDGRIRTPVEAPWLSDYVYEHCEFTGLADVEDDQVDATAHLYNALDQMLRGSNAPRAGTSIKAPGLPFG